MPSCVAFSESYHFRMNGRALATGVVTCAVLATGTNAGLIAQERESARPDLSGRWKLNVALSEDAEAKISRMQSSQGHGPGRHFGFLGRLFGRGSIEEARRVMLDAPSSFTLRQDDDRVVLTNSDGHMRTLVANGRKEKIDGRDVVTKWEQRRLVSEVSFGDAKVTEFYERGTTGTQLIVTSRMEMRGHDVSVRRVYDAEGA